MAFESKTNFNDGKAIIQWFRTGEFVRDSRMGERVERVKGVDQYLNEWRGEGKVAGNEIVEVIKSIMVGPKLS